MTAEALSRADVSNLVLDTPDQVNVFLMAGLLGVGGFVQQGGDPDLEALRAAVSDRLAHDRGGHLARLGQRPGGPARRPVWLTSAPDLEQHVRLTGPVEGLQGLERLCARLMTERMPRDRPLWELLVVPGASPAGPGIVLRIHHAMADGAAGVELAQALLDEDGDRLARGAGSHDQPPRTFHLPSARQVWAGLLRVTSMVRGTLPPTVLLGPLGPSREVAFTGTDLEPLRRSTRAAGATVNDALLAAVAGALAQALDKAGEPVPEALPTSVPVALPGRGTSGNAVGVMLVHLPTGEPDAARRLVTVARATRAGKGEARAQGTFELARTRWGSWAMTRLARRQRFVALFVTNVRGPAARLSVGGAPLVHAWPLAQIQGNVRLSVAAMSYAGRLCCTVHVNSGAVDARLVADVLTDELERLSRLPSPPGEGLGIVGPQV